MRTLLKAVFFPAAVLTVALGSLQLDRVFGWHGIRVAWAGRLLVLAGAALIAWCWVLFAGIGEGTPHPFVAKTKRLVIVGPYRYVRNPMMWGVGSVVAGLALWLGSAGVWLWFAATVLFVLWFVPNYEERDMERRFGEEYRQYCRQVPRWWPRLRSR